MLKLNIKINSGLYKSRRIQAPSSIRPTQDKIKQAIFNIFGKCIVDANVLDLFSGSGALGIEAISRGAKYVLFVESNRLAARIIAENIKNLKIPNHLWDILIMDAYKAMAMLHTRNKYYNIVFADPPYDKNQIKKILQTLSQYDILERNSIIAIEHSFRESIPENEYNFLLIKQKKYRDTILSFFKTNHEKTSHIPGNI